MSMTLDDMIAVIEAVRARRPTEWRHQSTDEWYPFDGNFWDFTNFEYRIKPEPPKPREWIIFEELPRSAVKGHPYPLCRDLDKAIHVREVLSDEERKA